MYTIRTQPGTLYSARVKLGTLYSARVKFLVALHRRSRVEWQLPKMSSLFGSVDIITAVLCWAVTFQSPLSRPPHQVISRSSVQAP